MVNSVGEYVAGEEYDLSDDESDRFVVLGYAEGELSREHSDDEIATMHEGTQRVSV